MKSQESMTDEIAVVNFAGGGGSDDGIERYTTLMIGAAINHDPEAIRMHKTNHPYTEHYIEDVFQVDPRKVCRGRPVGLAWFSPDCTHFSRAKGGTPVKKEIRGLSWVIVRWAMTVHPRVMMMENVPEIRTWGPLIADAKGNMHPDPKRKGETFEGFTKILTTGIEPNHPALLECCEFLNISPVGLEAQKLIHGLGYKMDWRELCAADYGVPTVRKRFFGVFRCDGQAIKWPEPTHAKRGSTDELTGKKKPWVSAASIIDWSIPAPSIFATKQQIKEQYGRAAVRPLAENTIKRIARGLDKFILKEDKPFIVEINHGGDNFRGQDIAEPLNTVTAKHGRGVIDPVLSPIMPCIGQTGGSDRVYSVTSPVPTIVSKAEACVAAPLMAPYLTQYHQEQTGDARGQKVDNPIMTIDSSNRYGLAAPLLSKYYGNDDHGQSVTEPLHTVTARDRESLLLSHICKFKGQNIGQSSATPLHTVTATCGEFACIHTRVVKYQSYADIGYWPQVRKILNAYCGYHLAAHEILLKNIGGEWYFIADIGLRMLTPREAFKAMGFAPDYIIDKDYNGQAYPKAEQMNRCGNAVCPPMAGLLAAANLPEYARGQPISTQQEWIRNVSA